jgi:hypothetical protein
VEIGTFLCILISYGRPCTDFAPPHEFLPVHTDRVPYHIAAKKRKPVPFLLWLAGKGEAIEKIREMVRLVDFACLASRALLAYPIKETITASFGVES